MQTLVDTTTAKLQGVLLQRRARRLARPPAAPPHLLLVALLALLWLTKCVVLDPILKE